MTMRRADELLFVKSAVEEFLPNGLSLIYEGKYHLWPARFRPRGETFADTMGYTMKYLANAASIEDVKNVLLQLEQEN